MQSDEIQLKLSFTHDAQSVILFVFGSKTINHSDIEYGVDSTVHFSVNV